MSIPSKGIAYEFYISLVDSAAPTTYKVDPTLATGDFKISKDGGALANLATLPVVSPAGSSNVKVVLSATEMDADKVSVLGIDLAGAEWNDLFHAIDVPTASSEDVYEVVGGNQLELLTHNASLYDQIRNSIAVTETHRGAHTHQPIGLVFYVDPVNGASHASGARGGISDPYDSVQDCHDNAVTDSHHDLIILLSGSAAGTTTMTEAVTITKRYLFIRGPGRDFIWTRTGNGDTITIEADGVELSGFQLTTDTIGVGDGIYVEGYDFFRANQLWIGQTQGHGIHITNGDNFVITHSNLHESGQSGAGHGIVVTAGPGQSCNNGYIQHCEIHSVQGDGIQLDPTGNGTVNGCIVEYSLIQGATGDGILIKGFGARDCFIHDNYLGNNSGDNINDSGNNTILINNIDIVQGVWDEVLSGPTHNIKFSAGKRLRQLASAAIHDGLAVGPGANGNQIILDVDAADYDGAYDPALVTIIFGTGYGQSRLILQYEGATRTATVDRNWKVLPDNTSEFIISGNPGREHVNEGLAQAGTTNTIKLNALASDFDNAYKGQLVFLRSGKGEDQVGLITAYDGTTKIATVEENWFDIPDDTTGYVMLPSHIDPEGTAKAVWSEPVADNLISGSFGELLSDVLKLTGYKVTKDGTIITIYEADGSTPWRQYDLAEGGRVEV